MLSVILNCLCLFFLPCLFVWLVLKRRWFQWLRGMDADDWRRLVLKGGKNVERACDMSMHVCLTFLLPFCLTISHHCFQEKRQEKHTATYFQTAFLLFFCLRGTNGCAECAEGDGRYVEEGVCRCPLFLCFCEEDKEKERKGLREREGEAKKSEI